MYIACPQCDTKFVVTPKQIGLNGRKVKCSKCLHVWHYKLDTNIVDEPVITKQKPIAPIGNGVNLPALVKSEKPSYLFLLPGFVMGAIIVLLVFLFPQQVGINSFFNKKDVAIQDVKIVKDAESEKIVVKYKVHNNSASSINIPLIRISLFDQNHDLIQENIDNHSKIMIDPGKTVQIKTQFLSVHESVKTVDIMAGNKLDFILYK
ncbi:MAG: zinc-ribbon domain-containing protein [Rickettsiaceae bacterium]|nr:zinc-ribbon domain-containing protein [Rickettsiaceae bacterium]